MTTSPASFNTYEEYLARVDYVAKNHRRKRVDIKRIHFTDADDLSRLINEHYPTEVSPYLQVSMQTSGNPDEITGAGGRRNYLIITIEEYEKEER